MPPFAKAKLLCQTSERASFSAQPTEICLGSYRQISADSILLQRMSAVTYRSATAWMSLTMVLLVGLPQTTFGAAIPNISAAEKTETSVQIPPGGDVLQRADGKHEKRIYFEENSSVKSCGPVSARVPTSRIISCGSRYCCTVLCSGKCTAEVKCTTSNCFERERSKPIHA